ncbi:hypothetical protein [Flavobacterium limnophilum]|uniref:hypothetical protein n=1 Tax=Flavobacterium limnophilum TaxID=3003262 RepID=UPI0022AC54B7|nr:hypothetical protein [Flavobacterium limnophilum]
MHYIILIFVLFSLELIYFKIADKCNIIDQPNNGSSYSNSTVVSLTLCQDTGKTSLILIQNFIYLALL